MERAREGEGGKDRERYMERERGRAGDKHIEKGGREKGGKIA